MERRRTGRGGAGGGEVREEREEGVGKKKGKGLWSANQTLLL